MKHILNPFNREPIETKAWKTCGEPCPITCKKSTLGRYKSDYEPYEGFGPLVGIFNIHESQKVVELVDAYGFDAIEAGQLVGFIFDALEKGLLKPEEVGLPGKPYFNPYESKLEYSRYNSDLAVQIIGNLAWGRNPLLKLIGEKGLRAVIKILDIHYIIYCYENRVEEASLGFSDLLVHASFGDEGHITPNY